METVEDLKKKIKELELLVEEQQKEIDYDHLTTAYTRNWYKRNVTDETDCYIAMVDVNCLRTINFVLGHNEGDALIKAVFNSISKYGDVVRIGGDEFIVIIKDKESADKLNNVKDNKYAVGMCYKPSGYPVGRAQSNADRMLYDKKKYNKTGGQYEDQY